MGQVPGDLRGAGGFTEPESARFETCVAAQHSGRVAAIDNRRLAKVAKLAGAPASPEAGVVCLLHIDDDVTRGQPLYSIHAQTPGQLDYALVYAHAHPDIFELETGADRGG